MDHELPIYIEFGLTALTHQPHFLEHVFGYARRVAAEQSHFQGEAKISFFRDDKKRHLIKLQWLTIENSRIFIFKTAFIEWPTGAVFCERCRGAGKYQWDNGRTLGCSFCQETGITGSIFGEPDVEI